MHLATRYTTSIHKSKSMNKFLVLNQTKWRLLKLKNGNVFVANKNKNERAYIKSNKTPKLNVFNNNNEKHKLLRRNVPFKHQVELSPTAIANGAIKRKPFEKKSRRGTTNHVSNVKLHKLLHKLDKLNFNLRVNRSKLIMDFLHAKSNIRMITLHVKGVIITIANNTMKSNAMASSNYKCPSSMEATIPKNMIEAKVSRLSMRWWLSFLRKLTLMIRLQTCEDVAP